VDAELVKKYCQKNKVRFLYKENKGQVLKDEEVARNERYSFFEQCANKFSLKVVCTAHHRDDQLETVLFRLARGTGPNGLSPIKEFRELSCGVQIFRPLLNIWKKDISKYAIKNKISYVEDKTNLNVVYKRNLIRRKILPQLKKINPEAENNILAFSDLAYSQNEALNTYFSLLLKKIKIGSPLILNRNKFLKLDSYTQIAFIYWFFTLYGIKGAVSKVHIIRNAIINQKKIDLSKKYIMNAVKNKVVFTVK
jgi:tRNA(Ile)-lysidine synthase